jgi:hypothetical protein
VELEITEAVDLRTAAIGDLVRARVQRDVKQKGEVIVPKGAVSTGRISRLEKYETGTIVGMEFPEIEAPGILARMKGNLDHAVGLEPVRGFGMHVRTPRLSGEGLFPIKPTQRHLPRGCIMFWRT